MLCMSFRFRPPVEDLGVQPVIGPYYVKCLNLWPFRLAVTMKIEGFARNKGHA